MPTIEITSQEQLRALVGEEVAVGDWFEVTQERINQFADATEDHQWIHSDTARAAAESPFGTTIAHGFLTLSLMSHLVARAAVLAMPTKMGINYGLNKVRFVSPVPSGARIRARLVLAALEDIPGGQQLAWNVTIEREGAAKPCLVAEWLVRRYE